MNVNKFLTPFIAVNSDGVRAIRPNTGEGHRGLISSRLRLLYSNALGIKKFHYVAYKKMPPEVIKDGVYHIRIEGLLEALQQKRERLNEALFICQHIGAQFNKEYRARCTKVIVNTINGQLTKEWKKNARTTLFQAGLQTLKGLAFGTTLPWSALHPHLMQWIDQATAESQCYTPKSHRRFGVTEIVFGPRVSPGAECSFDAMD